MGFILGLVLGIVIGVILADHLKSLEAEVESKL